MGGTPEDVVTGVWTGAYVEGCVAGHHRGVEDQQNESRSPAVDAAGQCMQRRDTGGGIAQGGQLRPLGLPYDVPK